MAKRMTKSSGNIFLDQLMSLDYLVGLCAKAKVDVGLRLVA